MHTKFPVVLTLLALAWMPAHAKANEEGELVTISRAPDGGTIINPLLMGAQYTFFSPPIKQSLKSPALLQSWRDMPVKVLRFPGGTWADHYIWDEPENSYFVAGATARTVVNVDQFLDNAAQLGAAPIIQVSTNSKGGRTNNLNPTKVEDYRAAAQWAARWVQDINIKKKRGVKYWEIGNEVWIWYKADEYARLVVEYSKAMKKVDPSIKIIACGLSGKVGPFAAPWLNFKSTDPDWTPRKNLFNTPDEWTQALLKIAGDHIDYIAPHPYMSAEKKSPDARSMYLDTTGRIVESAGLRGQQDMIRKSGSDVRLAVTEWVTNFGSSVPGSNSWSKDLYFYSHGNGINAGYYFGRILEGADVTDLAVIHALEDIQTLWYWPRKKLTTGTPILHPVYKAMQVWGANLGGRALVEKARDKAEFEVNGKKYPASYSYASEDKDYIYIVAFNLDPDKVRKLEFHLDGLKVRGVGRAMLLSAPSLQSHNFDSWEGEQEPESDIKTREIATVDGGVKLSLPAASMVGIRLPKGL